MLENPPGALAPDLLFAKFFEALDPPHGQRSQLLMYLECQSLGRSMGNLKTGSIKLFGAYQNVGEVKLGNDVFASSNTSGPSENVYEDTGDQEVLLLKRKGSRNRHGNEATSIRKSIGDSDVGNSYLSLGKW